ncbi:hypothetical protein ONZ45_g8351 [Pleurotus djamor]|nr:hypothetical protein ONZ45_g8351 [Pleurotus djamor]
MDDDDQILLMALMDEESAEEEEETEASNGGLYALILLGAVQGQQLRIDKRHPRRLYLIRPDLLPNPRVDTPWQKLYAGQRDRAFITTMGVDVATFTYILGFFASIWDSTPIPRNDVNAFAAPRLNRRSLDAAGALGLVLHFLTSSVVDTTLCQIFALVPSSVSRYIKFGLVIMLKSLRRISEARIQWPKGNEFRENSDLIVQRHPLLEGGFGSLDGLNLMVQTSSNMEIENATFNGWLHEHFVSSVLAFSATGVIIACRLNAPGSWHDSRVASPIYEKLRTQTPDGFYLIADTAFPRGQQSIDGKIKVPLKEGSRLPQNAADRTLLMATNRQLLSYRQTAEWGNKDIQACFGRLRVPLPINYSDVRGDLLEIIMRLFNLRTRLVGFNQIRSVYLPCWLPNDEEGFLLSLNDMVFADIRKHDRVAMFHLGVSEE